jgi:hypothetical protein
MTPLSPRSLRERIAELEELFRSAPSDQRQLVEDLTSGRMSTRDLHEALDTAHQRQKERDGWVLANWPYVVEHQELLRLAESHDPLASWPRAMLPSVSDTLDRLAAEFTADSSVEPRSLAELEACLTALDPASSVRELNERLVRIDDELASVASSLGEETDPIRRQLLEDERFALAVQRIRVGDQVGVAQALLRDRRWECEVSDLQTAISRRAEFVYHSAVKGRPEWLLDALTALDESAPLAQLSARQLREQVLEAAVAVDRSVTGSTGSMSPTRSICAALAPA